MWACDQISKWNFWPQWFRRACPIVSGGRCFVGTQEQDAATESTVEGLNVPTVEGLNMSTVDGLNVRQSDVQSNRR